MEDLSDFRKSYQKDELIEANLPDDAIQLFHKWFHEAKENENGEANAMTISSIGLDGFPKSRVVLLKKYSEEGFIFYTNYDSEKGKAIANNPNVCLSFFWQNSERQIIIKGVAKKIEASYSDAYFQSRPFGSQLGAIVSNQSEVIPDRAYLEHKLKEAETKFTESTVERPNNWGGILVQPTSVEFWQGRPNRLHDRIRYTLQGADWLIERLAP